MGPTWTSTAATATASDLRQLRHWDWGATPPSHPFFSFEMLHFQELLQQIAPFGKQACIRMKHAFVPSSGGNWRHWQNAWTWDKQSEPTCFHNAFRGPYFGLLSEHGQRGRWAESQAGKKGLSQGCFRRHSCLASKTCGLIDRHWKRESDSSALGWKEEKSWQAGLKEGGFMGLCAFPRDMGRVNECQMTNLIEAQPVLELHAVFWCFWTCLVGMTQAKSKKSR